MSVEKSRTLKGLESQLAKLDGELASDKLSLGNVQREYEAKLNKKDVIIKEIAKLKTSGKTPIVSEHAILRYLEHYHHINLDAVRNEILTDRVKSQIEVFGSCKIYANKNGSRMVTIAKDNTIVTVYPEVKE